MNQTELKDLVAVAAKYRLLGKATIRIEPRSERTVDWSKYSRKSYNNWKAKLTAKGLNTLGRKPKNTPRTELVELFGYGTKLYRRAYVRISRGQPWDDLKALAINVRS